MDGLNEQWDFFTVLVSSSSLPSYYASSQALCCNMLTESLILGLHAVQLLRRDWLAYPVRESRTKGMLC